MRKKLDTRFPAARIKKIMQADEDIGKIAMAVPLLVSKALELFLQDLCDRTYEVTLKKGAKTVNSLHLKQCIQNFNTFDFLKDTISRVPDLGGSEVVSEDISATKRRKISEDEEYVNDEEAKRTQMSEIGHISSSGRDRGRGRGRGRGRPRGSGTIDRELTLQYVKCEDVVEVHYENGEVKQEPESRPDEVADAAELGTTRGKEAGKVFRNFDLNVDLNEHGDYLNEKGDSSPALRGATTKSSTWPASNRKHEDILGWSLDDMEKMALDPTQLANLNGGISEEEEDYDEED